MRHVTLPVSFAAVLLFASSALAQTPEAAAPPAVPPASTESAPAAPSVAAAPTGNEAERNATVLAAIANLAPMIGDVQIVGPWVDGARHGIWRTIMTQTAGEATGSRFFVQQIEEKDGSASVVSSSVEVTEIAAIEGAITGYRADPPAEGEESNLTLFFDIVPTDGEIAETYELFVAPNQPYRFGPASN
jgi:hypothetical protein